MFRRSVVLNKRVLVRGYDFAAAMSKVGSHEARADLARLSAMHNEVRAAAAEASKPVEPIDWAHYKKAIKSEGIVDALEKAYKSIETPAYVDSVASEADAALKKLSDEAKHSMEVSAARITELEALLAKLEANVTTENTTIDQVAQNNPHLAAEAKAEIANNEWNKSI